MLRLHLLIIFLLLIASFTSRAQTFNYHTQGQDVISLDGQWRFHTGDDAGWAARDFDDSGWSLLQSDQPWGSQGYKGYSGFGWYRFRVKHVGHRRLALLLPSVRSYYQLFVNGRLVAEGGHLPPHELLGTPWDIHPLPTATSALNLSLALRVWSAPFWTSYGGGGLDEKGAVLGTPELVAHLYQAHQSDLVTSQIYDVSLDLIKTLTILTTLCLFFYTGLRDYEYLWFGLYEIFLLIQSASYVYGTFVPASFRFYLNAEMAGNVSTIFEILFFARILEAPRNWLFWTVLARTALVILTSAVSFDSPVFDFCAMVVYYVWLFWATWRGARRGLLDARLVMAPLYLLCCSIALGRISNLPGLPVPVTRLILSIFRNFSFGPINVNLSIFNGTMLLLAIWAILIARFVRTRREEQQHTNELVAARAVQHMLIPDEVPSIPGFSIASAYRPARVVGGDFFQIIPAGTGVLLAIGDVSGEGPPAAMTVSLIVGILRTLAEETTHPAGLLQGLNRGLVGRGTGFTTCLIAYLDRDGHSLLANAGHFAPYRNGEELATPPNLPLGVVEDTAYQEVPLTLDPKDRLTFVSDGVIEARNNKGELFGFARTQQHSTQSAEFIANAAKRFGQDDDITVLTVDYRPLALAS